VNIADKQFNCEWKDRDLLVVTLIGYGNPLSVELVGDEAFKFLSALELGFFGVLKKNPSGDRRESLNKVTCQGTNGYVVIFNELRNAVPNVAVGLGNEQRREIIYLPREYAKALEKRLSLEYLLHRLGSSK